MGYGEKEACHLILTKLHGAFSIFILNGKRDVHSSKRPGEKTWPGFWASPCCSHPRKGETLKRVYNKTPSRRIGFVTSLTRLFSFGHEVDYDRVYVENEIGVSH
jgi:isopentenyl-diphosphate delta-isomerase